MSGCYQTSGQTILEHGQSVWAHMRDLISGNTLGWRLPKWFQDNKDMILHNLPEMDILEQYALFHDCGKPFCRTEEDGKVHFPNHAEVSYLTWLDHSDDLEVATLIKYDMMLHTLKGEELTQFITNNTKKVLCSLLISALSELHSNAKMFGGIESDSFKIKWKALDKRGNKVCQALKDIQG